jgi:nucleoid DNA-binding protein
MRTKRTKGYIQEVAKKYNVSENDVEKVVESFFRFTTEVMKEGNPKTMDFADIRIMKWGVFRVKEGRKKFFLELNKKRENEKSDRNNK